MRCEEVKELLEAYIEGELDEHRNREIAEHISGCELCRKELTITRSIPNLVNSLSTPPVPEDIIADTLKRLHESSSTRRQWLRSISGSLQGKWQFAAAASLVLVAVFFGIGYQRLTREPGLTDAEAASAMEDLKIALGIVGAATQKAQFTAMKEGAQILDIARGESSSAIENISQTQFDVSEKLWRNLADLVQLNL